ncbi:MAG: lycopene cyclase domain-containing protein [Candidatus Kapaibacterium sp.]
MGHYTYLVIDLASIFVPLIASFHPRLRFVQTWRAFWPACLLVALAFCVWDSYYTAWGIWGFNPRYITGIRVANLPLEEVLFFICIPYASLFTYHCLRVLAPRNRTSDTDNRTTLTSIALVGALLITASSYPERLYTSVAFIVCAASIMTAWRMRSSWLPDFYRAFVVILIPFFIVNGLLTGTGLDEPVVWYNPAHHLGPRMLTIPVEDTFYGMAMLLLTTMIYEYLLTRKR